MSSAEEFKETFRQWAEVYMSRSMADTVRFVKRSEMSFAQYGTLMQLNHVQQCGVTDIANRLGVTNAAASQLIDKLVQTELVERTEDEHDRRVKQLTLTAKGREWVETATKARMDWINYLADLLTPEQRANAIRTFADLIAALENAPQPEAAPLE
jgi:DNA-binding MarR family transcriptional regulator